MLNRGIFGLQKYLLIAAGGAAGSIARYWVSATIASKTTHRFFYGTFVVNLSACLLIGFVITWLTARTAVNPAWRFLIPIGFIGAYSTFSTFEWETLSALESSAFLMGTLYAGLSVLLGLLAVWAGAWLARLVL